MYTKSDFIKILPPLFIMDSSIRKNSRAKQDKKACKKLAQSRPLLRSVWIYFEVALIIEYRAQPDWAYEFPDRTGPDTQICRTGSAGPD